MRAARRSLVGRCQTASGQLRRAGFTSHFYDSTVEEYATQTPWRLAMRPSEDACALDLPPECGLDDPGRNENLARFVRQQILIRLASTLRSFQVLPLGITGNPFLHRVFAVFWDNFQQIRAFPPPDDPAAEHQFAKLLVSLANVQASLLGTVSKGFREVREMLDQRHPHERRRFLGHIDAFLDGYVAQRISRRVLARHYLALRRARVGKHSHGIFDPALKPADVFRGLADVVCGLCEEEYGIGPLVKVSGDVSASLTYVDGHLSYVARELLKNAMRATVEAAGGHDAIDVPPVKVVVRAGGDGDVWVVISDRGGGMSLPKLQLAFGYGVSDFRQQSGSAPGPLSTGADGWVHEDADVSRLAGHGFGLPLSRNYLKYFGGELTVRSQEGHGTHVYLRLRPLAVWNEDLRLLAPWRAE